MTEAIFGGKNPKHFINLFRLAQIPHDNLGGGVLESDCSRSLDLQSSLFVYLRFQSNIWEWENQSQTPVVQHQ